MVRFLVTGVGGPAGSSLARQLMDRGHWVLGVDMQTVDTRSADMVARVSRSGAPGYLWELRGLIAQHGIHVVVPTVSDELVLVSEAKDDLAPGVRVVVADAAPVRTANDKFHTMTCLHTAGVDVPPFGLPSSFDSVHHAMDVLGGPLVVKPRVSRGGRGVQLLERLMDGGARAAHAWAMADDTCIVQRFAPGTEYAPVLHRTGTGTDVVVVLEKTALKEGRVGNAVSVRRSEASADRDVAALAVSAVEALGLQGPVDIDIRRMPDGTPVVLEVNARFGANSAHAPELLDSVLRVHAQEQLSGRNA
ncbi:ATP-grasp domain-containing protein [Paenarthrobacter sp. NPDC089714]|uniref:ATP-grasp domain-containing protein n=1 Tax=Paenarthrobacter sp. NPDC089714 TaxID=3364377 RepID=UPI00381D7898